VRAETLLKSELMPLPEFTKKLIEEKLSKYCINHIPEHPRDKVKLIFNINGNEVTLIETRPDYRDPSLWTENLVAQFRFDNDKKQWLLYFSDLNKRWYLYDLIKPSTDFDVLLKEVDWDPGGIFWG
jgi:hypothetical protein